MTGISKNTGGTLASARRTSEGRVGLGNKQALSSTNTNDVANKHAIILIDTRKSQRAAQIGENTRRKEQNITSPRTRAPVYPLVGPWRSRGLSRSQARSHSRHASRPCHRPRRGT